MASQLVLALQTIVSRQISSLDSAVVTVGSIHGGTKHNIIPDEVKLQITVRAHQEKVRLAILQSIEQQARGIAIAPGAFAKGEMSGETLPAFHSPRYAPVPEATLRTGLKAMTAAALELLSGRKNSE